MRLAFVTTYDPNDGSEWAMRGRYIGKSLEQQSISLHYVGPLRASYRSQLDANLRRLLDKRYSRRRHRGVIRDYARDISRKLAGLDIDIVFSPTSPGSQPIAYLESPKPIVIWSDATFAGALKTHPALAGLNEQSKRDGVANEGAALERCALAIYSSDWAARSAIDTYGLEPEKVKVVPFGPNLDCDRSMDDVRNMLAERPAGSCRLLFVARQWHAKGGDIALEVARELNRRGIPTTLTVVGPDPQIDTPAAEFVNLVGSLNKVRPGHAERLDLLLATSHFLILPSRADAAPRVICEASSFGLPSLVTRVGGVPSVLRDDVNGKTFALDASVDAYADYVTELLSDPARYRHLAVSSFAEYEARLSWSVAGRTVKQLMEAII